MWLIGYRNRKCKSVRLSVTTKNIYTRWESSRTCQNVTDKFTNRVPVLSGVTAVFGTPLLTLFAALWLHEFDTGLAAPTVSQLAICLVSCFKILKSANTAVGTFVVNIPVNNTVVNRTTTVSAWLWRFVLFTRIANISGLSRLILSYVLGVSAYIFVYKIGALFWLLKSLIKQV